MDAKLASNHEALEGGRHAQSVQHLIQLPHLHKLLAGFPGPFYKALFEYVWHVCEGDRPWCRGYGYTACVHEP